MTTPIRNLVLMMDEASRRQGAIETDSVQGRRTVQDTREALRVWSRQQRALMLAVVAEPPQQFGDVLDVLDSLATLHDEAGDRIGDPARPVTDDEAESLSEMTRVAVKNCAVYLAKRFRPDDEPTETQRDNMDAMAAQVRRWLPAAREDR